MKSVPQSVELIACTPNPLRLIAYATSKCYKTKVPKDREAMTAYVIKHASKHRTLLEHASATLNIITDRGVTHEEVRHRLASYTQESTRYCNYANDKFGSEITIVEPYDPTFIITPEFLATCKKIEELYLDATNSGIPAQHARDILPTCLKTEIVTTMNFRQWLYFLHMRLAKEAHPKMRHLAYLIWNELVRACPEIFEMLIVDDYHSLIPLMRQYEPERPTLAPHHSNVCPLCGSPVIKRYDEARGCLSESCPGYGHFFPEAIYNILTARITQLQQRAIALADRVNSLMLPAGVEEGYAAVLHPATGSIGHKGDVGYCGPNCSKDPNSKAIDCQCGTRGTNGPSGDQG